jgi:ATP-binding cassette subfamily F protein 2
MAPKREKPDRKGKGDKGKKGKNAATPEPDTESMPVDETPADALRRAGVVCTYSASSKIVHRNTRDIHVANITLLYHGRPMLEEAELSLNYGNRYGFIGRNGCGKSTFLKAIGARCFPIPEGIEVYHLKEEIEATEKTALEAVMDVESERMALEVEAEELNDLLTDEDVDDADELMDRLNIIYERLDQMDAATAEVRACRILTGLGFTKKTMDKMTKDFSGGWRMRIALARALFIRPTLLLLDEPTNHLDMEAVVWLEDYLSKWDKILFMVSHSQDFMNSVCTHVVHYTRKSLVYYGGNYDTFVNTKQELDENQQKRYAKEQDEIKHMKDYVARFGQGNAKMAKQAQSKEKTLAKMVRGGLTDKVETEKALDFMFPDPGSLSPPVLQCNDITFGYPGCEILYSGVDFGVDLDSRVALVGPNGAGKSTLLKLMTGDLQPVTGAVRPHVHLRISKFSQHFIDVLDLSMSPLEYFLKTWVDMTREQGRSFLGRFGVTGDVQTTMMEHLSDGQKSRVVLAKMAKENPHVLFLDEPTNHLDMESIDSLARAINKFSGGMVLVSHDMRLISQVAKEIWMCDNRTITRFTGEIDQFKMHLRQEMIRNNVMETSGKAAAEAAPSNKDMRRMFVPLTMGAQVTAPTMTIAPGGASAEEDSVKAARLELAELAIQKQRARKAKEKEDAVRKRAEMDEEALAAAKQAEEEKRLQKEKRKAEKEAQKELVKQQEEETERRRQQKEDDLREARALAAEKAKEMEEFRVEKAAKDAALKAEEAAMQADIEAAKTARREERRRAKQARLDARAAARQKAKEAAEDRVRADLWTQGQQTSFEEALLTYAAENRHVDKKERWAAIANAVSGKTPNQCLARYAFLKEYVTVTLKIQAQMDMMDK